VNKIEIRERKLPSEGQIAERRRDRLAVKIEQEVRALPERERRARIERFVPVVEQLASSEEGRRDLAAICAAYLAEHRPVTEVSVPAASRDPDADDRPPRSSGAPPSGGGRGRGRRPRRRTR
jgi:hypothetical protein